MAFKNNNTFTYYYYSAGNNEYAQANEQYNGLHISNDKTSAFIPNGWYLTEIELKGDDPVFDSGIVASVFVYLIYYKNGIQLKDHMLTMNTNDFDEWT